MLTKVTRLEKLGGSGCASGSTTAAKACTTSPQWWTNLARCSSRCATRLFFRVFLEFGAPTWPNGFDIAPEWLRREMEAAGELKRVAAEYGRAD